MNLRNGKVLLIQKSTEEKKSINTTKLTQNEKDIVQLLKKVCNALDSYNEINFTKEEIFNEKLRVYNEFYYLVEYYNVRSFTKPGFDRFIIIYNQKAQENLTAINKKLHRSSGYNLSIRDRLNARNFAKELTAILK